MPELLSRLSGLKEKIPGKWRKSSTKPSEVSSREILRSRDIGYEKKLHLGEEELLSYAQERLGLFLRGSRPGSIIFRATEEAIRAKMLESIGVPNERNAPQQNINAAKSSEDPKKRQFASFAASFNTIFELYTDAVHTHFREPGYDRSKNKNNVIFLAAEAAYRDFCLLFEQNQGIQSIPTTTHRRTEKQMYEAFLSQLKNYNYTHVSGKYPGNGTFVTTQHFKNEYTNIAVLPTGKSQRDGHTHYRDITISTNTRHTMDSNLISDPLTHVIQILNFESLPDISPRVIYVSTRSMQDDKRLDFQISKIVKDGKEKIKLHKVKPVTKARSYRLWPPASLYSRN